MTDEERKIALHCLKVSSDRHSEVCQECIKFHNCDPDDVTETIIKALEQEPCEDAVSRQAVLEGIAKWVEDGYADSEADISHISSLVTHLPSVTPIRKVGKWITPPYTSGYHCSLCKFRNNFKGKYCPNCGAKMEVEE